MNDAESLCEALRIIRVLHQESRKVVSLDTKLSISMIGFIEKGIRYPTRDIINRYAHAFNIEQYKIFLFAQEIQRISRQEKGSKILLIHYAVAYLRVFSGFHE